MSNRIGQIVNHLIINEEDSEKMLCAAIKHYIEKKGKIKSLAKNLKWLDDKQQNLLWETNEKGEEVFQRRLYRRNAARMFLFQAINDGIKSGTLNFNHSYRYRFLEEYLILKQEWQTNKEQLLTDAEMTHLTDCKGIIQDLEGGVDKLSHQVNDNYNLGLNPHLRFDKHQKPIITTPAVENPI